jgi:hypothetical protein
VIDEEGIWNSFRGKKENYCCWLNLSRAINRPDWSLLLEGNTELWILFFKSDAKKVKFIFDNNIQGYAELSRLVAERVERRGIRIEGK